ncbi:Cytoplasmic 60S subunit biogenesis factor REH1 [Spathaspora sp. JA1]|nr:Cytoplasmic 60S subunit biogenesis factor REH1 [Spathaspora sp. JA1]
MSFMPQGSNPETASFTCNTCGIKFVSAELQRQHMKTEWHRYNLKRRVAQLPSISSEIFAEKILNSGQYKYENRHENEDEFGFYVASRKRKSNGRQITKKSLKSQQRRTGRGIISIPSVQVNDADNEEEGEVEVEEGGIDQDEVSSQFSQFSLDDHDEYHEVESVDTGSELNYTESDFTDLEGEILSSEEDSDLEIYDDEGGEDEDESMEQKSIPITHCFYCGQNNHEIENNIKHMFSKHGLYIPERSFLIDVEGLLTYLSEIISLDHECLVCGFEGRNLESLRQHIASKGHCKIPYETKEEKLVVAEFYDFMEQQSEPEKNHSNKHVGFSEDPQSSAIIIEYVPDEEEEDSDASNGINDNYALVQVDRSGVELTTPTGSRIGHRTMARYYRQNIPLPREVPQGQQTQALVDRRFASGLDIYQVSKEEKAIRRAEQRAKNDKERKTKSSKANYQKHFRDEILGT